jgi:exodeoxyribonuclease VII small subunit
MDEGKDRRAEKEQSIARLSMSECLQHLQTVTRKMESGAAPIEELVDLHESAILLHRRGHAILKGVRATIQLADDGEPMVRSPDEPFEL